MTDFHLCPRFEAAFELLGTRWTGLIIRVLLKGPQRFKDISSMIEGMSDKMLVSRLKQLESVGIIKRTVFPETPVRIVYELTEKGSDLEPALDEIQKWAEKWIDA